VRGPGVGESGRFATRPGCGPTGPRRRAWWPTGCGCTCPVRRHSPPGCEFEQRYLPHEDGWLEEAETAVNATGDVDGLAPPGDIHLVRNNGSETAISLHIYGTDISRLGGSVRRVYDLPMVARDER